MFYAIRKLYRPEFYQGPNRHARYFEGWYYKAVVDNRAFALIPGVSRAPDDPHAFIQYIDGETAESAYYRFPLDRFSYRRDRYEIAIDSNRFSLDGYEANLEGVSCRFEIGNRNGWPTSIFVPGTMGWYSFVPFMECKHAVLIMDADLRGTLNGERVDGARLYVEKDYGRSFPNAWIWLQSNSFGTATSVSCSIGNVPFVGGAFTGFLAAILHEDTLHRFTTYTGAKLISLDVDESEVRMVLADRRRQLEISARREDGTALAAPALGLMRGRIIETIRSSVDVRLVVDGSEVYVGTGNHAGLEVMNPDLLAVT